MKPVIQQTPHVMSSQKRPNQLFVKSFIFFLLLVFSTASQLSAQDLIEISGIVTGQDTKEALAGVTVSIKGSVNSTVTSNDGSFKLRTRQKVPFTLLFSSIGFGSQEV